jgi:hypothetical protein
MRAALLDQDKIYLLPQGFPLSSESTIRINGNPKR